MPFAVRGIDRGSVAAASENSFGGTFEPSSTTRIDAKAAGFPPGKKIISWYGVSFATMIPLQSRNPAAPRYAASACTPHADTGGATAVTWPCHRSVAPIAVSSGDGAEAPSRTTSYGPTPHPAPQNADALMTMFTAPFSIV